MGILNFPIDFVISWVDSSDKEWLTKKRKFVNTQEPENISDASDERYRDFGFFKYLFRSIETNAPWVNHVYVVTDTQIPTFLNTQYDKVSIVDHTEIIPHKYLPTFNSSVIEMYLNNIPGLAEHFVYFNDDMVINQTVQPEDFFDLKGKPKDAFIPSMLQPRYVNYFEENDMRIINTKFNKRKVLKENFPLIFNYRYGLENLMKILLTIPFQQWSTFKNLHLPYSLRKEEFTRFEEYGENKRELTSKNKFRSEQDINIWLLQDIRYCLGDFSPRTYKIGKYYDFDSSIELIRTLKTSRYKLLVINDDSNNIKVNRQIVASRILDQLKNKFPEKSRFEK